MPNIGSLIDTHNKKVTPQASSEQNHNNECNCRIKQECPLDGRCREKNIIYQASVTTQGRVETYVGLTTTEFKTRFANHKQSFEKTKLKNATELSKHVWELKEKNKPYRITWKILAQGKPYSNATKRCNLCLSEKFFIICKKGYATLNQRSELVNACRHKARYKLDKV